MYETYIMIWIIWITFAIESFNVYVAPGRGNRKNVKKNFYAGKLFTNIFQKANIYSKQILLLELIMIMISCNQMYFFFKNVISISNILPIRHYHKNI